MNFSWTGTVVIALLALFALTYGVLPALTAVDSDFPNYYTSARMLLEKKDLSRLYDDDAFQGEIHGYGIGMQGKFSPFPPITALMMVPVAWLPPLDALRVWTGFNIFLFFGCVALLVSAFGGSVRWNAFLLLASGLALANNFRLGQAYLLLLFLVLAACTAYGRGSYVLAGILLGVGAAVKYFPLIFLPLHLARGEWKIAGTLTATVAVLYGAGVLILGMPLHAEFLSRVLPHHLAGEIQDPFSPTFQSFDSLFRRLFIYDPALNPSPLVASPRIYTLALGGVLLAVVALTACACRAIAGSREREKFGLQLAIVTLAGLLILPASATYHFLLLLIPVAVFLSRDVKAWGRVEFTLVGAYAMIGFLPYRVFRGFEHTPAVPLAYPRLWLMTVLFICALLRAQSMTLRKDQ
jgi:hypothetical protein